jgi:hypothetical protein
MARSTLVISEKFALCTVGLPRGDAAAIGQLLLELPFVPLEPARLRMCTVQAQQLHPALLDRLPRVRGDVSCGSPASRRVIASCMLQVKGYTLGQWPLRILTSTASDTRLHSCRCCQQRRTLWQRRCAQMRCALLWHSRTHCRRMCRSPYTASSTVR